MSDPTKNSKDKALIALYNDADVIKDNPHKFYNFTYRATPDDTIDEENSRSGKSSVVCKVTSKIDGAVFAAKQIYFEDDAKFAEREYTLMKSQLPENPGLVKLHKAYLIRKYLILIMDFVEGEALVEAFSQRHSATEDDVAVIIRQLCEILSVMHAENIVHLDIRPTNIRFEGRDIKLLDYNSCRKLANKKSGAVVDVLGDTEFCAPEMLNFDPVQPGSDMWSVAVITYILLSGISPFFYEDEAEVVACVGGVKWSGNGKDGDWPDAFDEVSTEAKEFITKNLIRAPETRMTSAAACKHAWLSSELMSKRKKSNLDANSLQTMIETDARLLEEEAEDYCDGSFVFRTFEEEEYDSPVEEDDEDED